MMFLQSRLINWNIFSYPITFLSYSLFKCNFCTYENNLEKFKKCITDAKSERKIKSILLEYHTMKEMGMSVPKKLTTRDVEVLSSMKKRSERRSFITNVLVYREEKGEELRNLYIEKMERKMRSSVKNHIQYGVEHNCLHALFHVLGGASIYSSRLAQAAKFGQPLVIDVGYDDNMNEAERMITANQIRDAYGVNRFHRDPFDLYLCNFVKANVQNSTQHFLERLMRDFYHPKYMMTLTEKSYLDIFTDKSKIIYLSYDAKETMETFDPDAVYIIGGLVNLVKQRSCSLEKATKEGVQILRFPLEKYLYYKPGFRKHLSLRNVTKILLDLKISGDWRYAFDKLPNCQVLSRAEQKLVIDEALFDRTTDLQKLFKKIIY